MWPKVCPLNVTQSVLMCNKYTHLTRAQKATTLLQDLLFIPITSLITLFHSPFSAKPFFPIIKRKGNRTWNLTHSLRIPVSTGRSEICNYSTKWNLFSNFQEKKRNLSLNSMWCHLSRGVQEISWRGTV